MKYFKWKEMNLMRQGLQLREVLAGPVHTQHGELIVPQSDLYASTKVGASTGGRYVGRSASRTANRTPSERPALAKPPRSGRTAVARSTEPAHVSPTSSLGSVTWSLRVVIVLTLVLAVALAWRLMGLLTPPLDAGTGAEATHAAFANVVAGRITAPDEATSSFALASPWTGPAPVNPASSVPIYTLLAGSLMGVLGTGEWLGRVLSMAFSLLAGLALFGIVRRAAGARAAIYALVLFAIAPLSVTLGQQFGPASLVLLSQALAIITLLHWRSSTTTAVPGGSFLRFLVALAAALFAGSTDTVAIFLAFPAAYIFLTSNTAAQTITTRRGAVSSNLEGLRASWNVALNRGKLIAFTSALICAPVLWSVFTAGGNNGIVLQASDGGAGSTGALSFLLSLDTYALLIGTVIEKCLTLVGLLLLVAGLMHGARPPLSMLFHVWLSAGLLHALLDASRLARHDDVLLPLLLPLCALAGIGASWAASLPNRLWLALTEHRHETDADYRVSPQTSWLLDLPEERGKSGAPARPQAELALGKSIAQRARKSGANARRAWIMGLGQLAVLAAFGLVALGTTPTIYARLQPSELATELARTGRAVTGATPRDARLIVVGPYSAELLYASGRTGWVLPPEDFNLVEVQLLQHKGATHLLSVDQEWLGKQTDYKGLLTNYGVMNLTRNYILFDLSVKPQANDRLYFLESGHTLGGEFRRFWEQHGGVQKLGYPISEEIEEANPIDGQVRRVQYFERAVLEYHPELAGRPDAVMLSAVGRWVTQGKEFQRAVPFESTPERAYFPQTGHSLKEAFLRYWNREGGVVMFGYPISEELPEISAADGKVYTVQYFERARFEWHPTAAGTPDEVQLGLIGKQALELGR